MGQVTKPPESRVYVEQKAELDAGATKFEVHGEDAGIELSEADAIKELLASQGGCELATRHCTHELKGDELPKELEASDFNQNTQQEVVEYPQRCISIQQCLKNPTLPGQATL